MSMNDTETATSSSSSSSLAMKTEALTNSLSRVETLEQRRRQAQTPITFNVAIRTSLFWLCVVGMMLNVTRMRSLLPLHDYNRGLQYDAQPSQNEGNSATEEQQRQRVVILPGPHKTGTTSIQYNLIKWSKLGLLGDWSWPNPSKKHHPLLYYGRLSTELRRGIPTMKRVFRQVFKEEWSQGKSLVFGHEEMDRILRTGDVHNGDDMVQDIFELLPFVSTNKHPNQNLAQGSMDDVLVSITYRSPRVDHLVSVWHEIGKGKTLSQFILQLDQNHNAFQCALNPLGLADAFVRNGAQVALIDTSGLKQKNLDISSVVACEILKVPCTTNHKLHGLTSDSEPKILNQKSNNSDEFDLNPNQIRQIDNVLNRFDCKYLGLLYNPKVRFLHRYNMFSHCGDVHDEASFDRVEVVRRIKSIVSGTSDLVVVESE